MAWDNLSLLLFIPPSTLLSLSPALLVGTMLMRMVKESGGSQITLPPTALVVEQSSGPQEGNTTAGGHSLTLLLVGGCGLALLQGV